MAEYLHSDIFSRNIGVFTPEVQNLLKDSCVAVAGIGGPGGRTAEALARMGVGHLKIADFDAVELHNINRQPVAFVSTIGRQKTNVMYTLLKDINPSIKVDVYKEGVTPANAAEFVRGADAVVDAVDYYAPEARQKLHEEARKNNQYVFLPPAAGFGVLVMCFGPESPTLEQLLEYPADAEQAKTHEVDHRKLMGCRLDYLPQLFFECHKQNPPYVSTNGSSVMIAGGVTAIQILKTLMYIRKKACPELFKEYGSLAPITIPLALRVDGWDASCCRVVDLNNLEGFK